jgi:CRISPR-associated protein Cmr3
LQWLKKPASGNWNGTWKFEAPQAEIRTHVSIASDRLTAADGALFSTEGRRYEAGRGSEARSLALAIAPDDDAGLQEGWGTLGGERRLARWGLAKQNLPGLPSDLLDSMVHQKACRVVLLTPAEFREGFRPGWLLAERDGLKPALVAAAVRRPEVVSGWNMATGKPKPTRRLAPAGSVYFVSLEGDDAAVRAWLERLWWRAVSDDEQARLDGFGVVALGAWDRSVQAGGAK